MTVSNRTYTITVSDAERKMLILGLAALVPSVRVDTMRLLKPEEFSNLAERLWDLSPDNPQQVSGVSSRATAGIGDGRTGSAEASPAIAQNALPELRDRWARNRKGEPHPNPEGCEAITASVVKLVQAPLKNGTKRLKVTWEAQGRGFGDGSCWDESLFPFLANRMKQPTTLYIRKKDNYTDVVGVRA